MTSMRSRPSGIGRTLAYRPAHRQALDLVMDHSPQTARKVLARPRFAVCGGFLTLDLKIIDMFLG